ncbi:MAG: hypothetical protein WB676_00245 [Bryobacteraceae bacterium]
MAVVGLYVLLAGFQIVGPVPIGLADNGDFPKIFGALSIGPAPGNEKAIAERYFVTDYEISRARYLWIAYLPSSEYCVAKAAKCLARWLLPHGKFDIRLMGIMHGLLMALALWLFVQAYRSSPLWVAVLAGALLLIITTDVEYVQFFSTAYADAAAIVFFCCTAAVVLNVCLRQKSGDRRWLAAFALFGILFLTSKLQYQVGVFPLCALATFFGLQTKTRRMRKLWLAAAGVFMVTTLGMAMKTRPNYRDDPMYSVIFVRLAPMSSNPNQVLKDFGLPDEYRKYIGVSPFQDNYLLSDLKQRKIFEAQVTLSKIASYYFTHPTTCLRVLMSDLEQPAADVNLEYWWTKHFRMEDYAAHKNDMRFKWWSSLRRQIALRAWLFGPLVYLLAFALVCVCAVRPRFRDSLPEWPVIGLVAFVGASTFAVASLYDDQETARHIILYQVVLDLLLFLFIVRLASLFFVLRRERSAKLMELATIKAQTAHPVIGANHRHL